MILNVACVSEAGIVTEVGTVKYEFVFARLTNAPVGFPVAGAAAVNVTVQVALAPDESAAGVH